MRMGEGALGAVWTTLTMAVLAVRHTRARRCTTDLAHRLAPLERQFLAHLPILRRWPTGVITRLGSLLTCTVHVIREHPLLHFGRRSLWPTPPRVSARCWGRRRLTPLSVLGDLSPRPPAARGFEGPDMEGQNVRNRKAMAEIAACALFVVLSCMTCAIVVYLRHPRHPRWKEPLGDQ